MVFNRQLVSPTFRKSIVILGSQYPHIVNRDLYRKHKNVTTSILAVQQNILENGFLFDSYLYVYSSQPALVIQTRPNAANTKKKL